LGSRHRIAPPCAALTPGLAALMYHNRPNQTYWQVMNYIIAYRDHSTDQHGAHQIAGLADFDATLEAWGKDPGR